MTECPASARRLATVPPPAPDPTTIYSQSACRGTCCVILTSATQCVPNQGQEIKSDLRIPARSILAPSTVPPKTDNGYSLPPADTGSRLLNWVSNAAMLFVHLERRFDPLFRSAFDFLFRELFTLATNAFINLQRKNEGYKLAEERIQPDEEAHLNDIIATMADQMRRLWRPGDFQRCGNTKTHGIVRGEVIIRDDIPEHMRRGIFAQPRTFRTWVRFSGPGPYITPDIDDVGFM